MIRAYQDMLRRGGRALGRPRRQVHGRRRARLFRLAAGARGRGRAGGAGRARADRLRWRGWRRPRAKPLAARVGIATGLVMVGELIGEGAAQEQAVVGETPNLAARLQALAGARQRGHQPGDAPAARRPVRARRPRAAAAQGLRRAAGRVAGRRRGPGRRALRGAPDGGPDAAGRPRRGDRAAAAPMAAGQRRRGACRPAVRRARDRQVASGARSARAAQGRAPRTPALPMLAAPHDQSAASADRAAGARRRLRARRSARGAARQAGGAAGARHRPASSRRCR